MKKRYGQHFLSDRNILQRIVQLARIASTDTVIEIGPGAGSLTRELAAAARRVIAIEIDHDLIPKLQSAVPPNVEILEADALEINLAQLSPTPFHIVGNLPYNIATPLLKSFIASRDQILDVTIMLQKEVAERLRATSGTKDYGPLSILTQYYVAPTWGFTVPPGAFTPRPKVDSAVIRLDWIPNIPTAMDFTDFVHRAFTSRRKKLLNNLLSICPNRTRDEITAALHTAGLSSDARPETLTVAQFLGVYNQLR